MPDSPDLPDSPDAVFLVHEDGDRPAPARPDADGSRFTTADAEIGLTRRGNGLAVDVRCPARGLSRVLLRWHRPVPSTTLVLGDAWERSYGDLQWRHLQPERLLPWSWLGHDEATGATFGMGVRVRPGAFCSWTVDGAGVSLWLDVRGGGSPVLLGDRTLDAATIVTARGAGGEGRNGPYAIQCALTDAMCDDPLPDRGPVVGCNNWYYAYGKDFGPAQVLRDAETVVEYAGDHPVRPYCVVDAGWSPGGAAPGGPWTGGIAGLFDDLPGLAARITGSGARPGIWMRPAALSSVDDPGRLRDGPRPAAEQPLDLTLPDNLETIRADVARIAGWGFELIKHDFSTFDAFGRFGPSMGAELTGAGWAFADRSRTNAEVLLRFYEVIREAAGDAAVLGCNTVGHLAAGLVDVQRTGDDTSGRAWERTRRMGINTLAFRVAQHRRFFTVDPDCVPCTPQTPWERNRQFLDLVARSGTALFVSVDPAARSAEVDADLRAAIRLALDGGDPGGVEPLDWLRTTAPRRWRSDEQERVYDWTEPTGAPPFHH